MNVSLVLLFGHHAHIHEVAGAAGRGAGGAGPGGPALADRVRCPAPAQNLASGDRGGRGLPVGAQRHVGRSVGGQAHPEDLVEFYDVALEAEA